MSVVPPFPPPAAPRPSPEPVAPATGITLAWFPEEQDYLEAFRAAGRKHRLKHVVIDLAIAAVTVGLGLLTDQTLLLVAGVVLPLVLLYGLGPGRATAIRTAFRRSTALQVFRQVHVSPEVGVTEWFAGFSGTSSWSRYSAVIETERVFVLVVHDLAGDPIQVLAKRGLPPEVDAARFGDALRSWVGATGRN